MKTINRSALLVTPGQPFLDWLHRADPTSSDLRLADLQQDPTVYLLPEYDTDEQALRHLKKACAGIFEEQLDSWYRVRPAWPAQRDFPTFCRWFDYQLHSVVMDLCSQPVILEEL